MSEAIAVLSFEEFCQFESLGEQRHELVGGRVYAMAGGSERHDLAAGLLYELLAPAARARGCRPFAGNRLVRTSTGAGYYPDVLVACGKAPHRLYEDSPSVVIEVLSRSTEDIDRREKAAAYGACPSLQCYVLVDPDRRRVEVATPVDGSLRWAVAGPGEVLGIGGADLDVDAFYDAIDAQATTF
jgi:Uma2 family endonuclease